MAFVMLPISVMATEQSTSAKNRRLSLACEVFPEYATSIQSNNSTVSPRSYSATDREVVISETRNVSDNQVMSYTEYSDGTVLIAYSSYSKSTTITDIYTGSQSTNYTADLVVDCIDSDQTFIVRNLKFTLIKQSYDCITSTGSLSDSTTNQQYAYSVKSWEDDSGPARVYYHVQFQPNVSGSTPFEPLIYFTVGSDSYSFTVV